MKICSKYKVREMAGEHVVIMQGRFGADMTKVISLNASSLWLWQELSDREFSAAEVAELLVAHYGVSVEVAENDSGLWIAKLRECGLLEE